MIPLGAIEERFEAAARNLCDRLDCFDFVRRVSRGDPKPLMERAAEPLKIDISSLGAVDAVKRRLHSHPEESVLLDLAASNRLDLSAEYLALCSAWKPLFGEAERRIAAERLLSLLSLSLPQGAAPSAGADLGFITDWLFERVARWEVDSELPKSRISYGLQASSLRTDQTLCDSAADTARELSEIGLIVTSVTQCTHYLHCRLCIDAFPQLERHLERFVGRFRSESHELLRLMGACLGRAHQDREGGRGYAVGQGDAIVWRAIVCGAGIMYSDFLQELSRALGELESGYLPPPALRSLLLEFEHDELYLLSFAEAASGPFIEVQWGLFDDDSLVYLPSDGDLWEIPGVVVLLNAPEIADWKRLMTGSDLAYLKADRDGSEHAVPIDGIGLFVIFNWAAAFKSQKRIDALEAAGGAVRQQADQMLRLQPIAPTAGEAEREFSLVAAPRSDAGMKTLLDRMADLQDMVASNSATQVPIIDTLQSVLKHLDTPSRVSAEESLRRELGDALCDRLCPMAFHFAVAAEYCWLNPNEPSPSRIVADLAIAFEQQLREVFSRFCEKLKAAGIRNYPERPGIPLLPAGNALQRPRPGVPVPTLLDSGCMTKALTLGGMWAHLANPLPALQDFLAQNRIQAEQTLAVLREVAGLRNRAVHYGEPAFARGSLAYPSPLAWQNGGFPERPCRRGTRHTW